MNVKIVHFMKIRIKALLCKTPPKPKKRKRKASVKLKLN